MTRFRFWLATLLLWLSVVFNLERVHEPINIASFVYVLAGLLTVSIVVIPPMRKAALSMLAAGSIALVIICKLLLGYQVAGASLPLTVTESTVILLTVALSHQIARHARRFELDAAELATARWQTRPKSFDDGQSNMYRELRRARRFDRPLSVVAFEPTPETLKLSVDRMVEEVRQEMVQHYIEVRLADAVRCEVEDFDLVTNNGERFIVMLPETDGQQALELTQRVAQRVERELGLQLCVGSAAFPQDEVTFIGLVERAESSMAARTSTVEDVTDSVPREVVLSMQ